MTQAAGPTNPKPVDWRAIGRRFADATVYYLHHAGVMLYGDDFYAAVARRALDGEQQARLPYETVGLGLGLITEAEAAHMTESHTVLSRLRAERAEEQVREMRAEVARVRRDAARDLVAHLREWVNERTVPSRYRREGVLLAAEEIDPDTPRDRYGNVVRRAAESEVTA